MSPWFPASYVPVRQLGRGGFGVVWAAVERGSGLEVVVKLPSGRVTSEQLARFRREIRLQSQLNHENVLPILDFDVDGEIPWFAAPKAEDNLDRSLPALSERQCIDLILDVVRGISYAHRNRVLHRDIKPENILVFKTDGGGLQAKVADFGLGRNFTRDTPFETATGVGIGTEWFAAPEQWLDLRSVDERADVFGLGRLLQYSIAVVMPDDSPIVRQLDYCIRTATAQSPLDRYHSVDEFANDLGWVLERPQSLQRPVDAARMLIQDLLGQGTFDVSQTRELAGFLLEHRGDYRLMLSMLPRIPLRLWSALLKHHAAAMTPVMEGYAEILDDALAMDSALAAMRLLEEVLSVSADSRIRELSLRTIVSLAARYDVGEFGYIAVRCLSGETDASTIQALARYVREHPEIAKWCADHLLRASLAPLLRDAIEEA
jgi:eukaryotic-like serine/threonine-protein kinase